MGNKGGLGHLKRLPAPSFWPIHRKEAEWAPKPNPGAHKSVSCLPIGVIVRDSLGIAKTHQEVARILSQGKVKIDGRTRHEENYPVGLMDVIELADANLAYRVLPIEKKGLSLIQIPKDAAAQYETNDTLRVSVPTQRILNHIKFERGNIALVVAGRNLGKIGKIVDLQDGTATRPAMVTIEDQTGNKFDTIVDYTFVVGSDKSAIKLEAN